MTDLQAQARAMFWSYACSTFYMAHDGDYETYKKFGISDAQEKEWRREFVVHWVARLATDDMTAVNWLRDADAVEALPNLLAIAGSGDSFAQGWIADAIWHIAERNRIPDTLVDAVARTSVSLWLAVANGPVEITESHKQWIRDMAAKHRIDGSTPEEYVQNRARNRLAALNSHHQ